MDEKAIMEIKFSRHARRQMKWRKIGVEEVRNVVSEPERLEDSIRGRKNAFKSFGGRRLKVTYKEDREETVIITAVVK